MRVDLGYLIASCGYLSYSLDSLRLISMCRHGVAARWLWSCDALSARSFLFCCEIWQLCVLSFIIFSCFDLKFTLPRKCPSRLLWLEWSELNKQQQKKKRSLHCSHNWAISKVAISVGDSHKNVKVRVVAIAARRILSVSLCGMSVKSLLVFQHIWKTHSPFAWLSNATSNQGCK